MHNAWSVFTRDLRRLLRTPLACVVILGIIVIPCLYAWVNIIAFWDPYSNTEDVKVAIVNRDEGASMEQTGEINVGDQIVEQLKDNHEIGWQFLDEDKAMHAVRTGDVYAAIVVPPEFSKDLLSVVSGDFVRPKLDYYVNEKANAIAPKITDAAASAVDTQVNSSFVSKVADVAFEKLREAGLIGGERLLDTQQKTLGVLDDGVAKLQSAREGLTRIEASLTDTGAALGDAEAALVQLDTTISGVVSAVGQTQNLVATVQEELSKVADLVTTAYVSGASQMAAVSAELNTAIARVTTTVQRANVEIAAATRDVTAVIDANGRALDRLNELLDGLPADDPVAQGLRDGIERLERRNEADQALLADLAALSNQAGATLTSIRASSDAIDAAIRASIGAGTTIQQVLTNTIPEVNRAMFTMSAAAGAFSAALSSQQAQIAEAANLLGSFQQELGGTVDALGALDGNIATAETGLSDLRADVGALDGAATWSKLRAITGLNAEQIAEFISSPVQVKEHALFPVANYGSAMAPLFTNLALWIGAFMLVVILRQEVDTAGISNLTVRQAYFGRWMLLGAIALAQALLVSIGNVIIGVKFASALGFVATSVFVGFVYLAIIYSLAVSFGHVGKGIILLLVVMQIPGASGIYPIEMVPKFFQDLYPFFPFSHGIDAMRETLGGFYGTTYLRNVAVLVLYAVLAFAIGIFLRQRLGSFTRLLNRSVAETGLYVSEDVQVLGSRRRLRQVVQALLDRERFCEETDRRSKSFKRHYRLYIRTTTLVALAAIVALGIVSGFVPDAKAMVLGLWLLVILTAVAFLVGLEVTRQGLLYAAKVQSMPEEQLQEELEREEAASRPDAVVQELEMQEPTA